MFEKVVQRGRASEQLNDECGTLRWQSFPCS